MRALLGLAALALAAAASTIEQAEAANVGWAQPVVSWATKADTWRTRAESLELEIRVVPVLEGLQFRLFRPCSLYFPAGQTAAVYCFSGDVPAPEAWISSTDGQGIARLRYPGPGLYHLQVLPWASANLRLRAEFSRWDDEVFTPERALVLASNLSLTVGMNVARPIRLEFVDPQGKAVASDRISSVLLRSSFGAVVTLEKEGPHWIPAERALRRDAGLVSVPIVYAVQRVDMDGSNVVNRGQLRLTAGSATDSWRLPLLLYSARFEGRDAFFGSRIGTGIWLEYPDGRQELFPFGASGEASISGLARGTYRARVAGAFGIALPTTVVLSRDQLVRPVVLSYLDLGVTGIGGLSGLLGLLFLGRPYLLPRAGRAARLRPSGSPRSDGLDESGGRP